ncbi:MAG: type II secretion system F family protein [Candidatus Eremiobacteraeota bacterium]|nr:type II secretion system F family protein [Candidatus Eremiobacteraeota bacterium]
MKREAGIIDYTKKLAHFVDKGIPVPEIIANTYRDIENPGLRTAFYNILKSMRAGNSFSDALKSTPGVYEDYLVKIIGAGEENNDLSSTLYDVAGYLQKRESLISSFHEFLCSKVISLDIIGGFYAIIFILFTPTLAKIVESYDITLPKITCFLISITHLFENKYFLIFYILFFVVINSLVFSRKITVAGLFFQFPLWRNYRFKANMLAVVDLLEIMLKRGFTLIECMKEISRIPELKPIKKKFAWKLESSGEDTSLPDVLYKSGLFPDIYMDTFEAIDSGEKLLSFLKFRSIEYRRELTLDLKKSNKTDLLFIMLFFGCNVFYIIMSFYMLFFGSCMLHHPFLR